MDNKWNGEWINFESFIDDQNKYMKKSWDEAEKSCTKMPMFSHGVKAFWKEACKSTNDENQDEIQKWVIRKKDENLEIEWLLSDKTFIDTYHLHEIIDKGLENKENYLFIGEKASPFKYLLVMAPMPTKEEYQEGGLLPHFHYQYASALKNIYDGSLKNKTWYPTMVYIENISLLDKCNIVRALHRLPLWDEIEQL